MKARKEIKRQELLVSVFNKLASDMLNDVVGLRELVAAAYNREEELLIITLVVSAAKGWATVELHQAPDKLSTRRREMASITQLKMFIGSLECNDVFYKVGQEDLKSKLHSRPRTVKSSESCSTVRLRRWLTCKKGWQKNIPWLGSSFQICAQISHHSFEV